MEVLSHLMLSPAPQPSWELKEIMEALGHPIHEGGPSYLMEALPYDEGIFSAWGCSPIYLNMFL